MRLETSDPLSRNHSETDRWQTKVNKLGHSSGCDRALVQNSFFRRWVMSLFLKPLIGFTTTTSVLTSLMVLVSHVG